MNIPIETVVELLIANRSWDRDAHHVIWDTKGAILTHAETVDELRTEVKAHIQTLVPKPVKLSECEEGLYFTGKYVPGISVMRDGEFAYEADGTCGGLAKDFEVIQPAEVK